MRQKIPELWRCNRWYPYTNNRSIQERALRFIYEDYENTYENLLKISKLPSLKIRRLRTNAVETFKIIHKQSPSYLNDLISNRDQKYICLGIKIKQFYPEYAQQGMV